MAERIRSVAIVAGSTRMRCPAAATAIGTAGAPLLLQRPPLLPRSPRKPDGHLTATSANQILSTADLAGVMTTDAFDALVTPRQSQKLLTLSTLASSSWRCGCQRPMASVKFVNPCQWCWTDDMQSGTEGLTGWRITNVCRPVATNQTTVAAAANVHRPTARMVERCALATELRAAMPVGVSNMATDK